MAYLPVPTEIEYNNYVYDVTVPNHRIFIIRNGKGCWSSNCWRALDAGFKIGWNPKAKITHFPHATIGVDPDRQKQFLLSYKRFCKKWRKRPLSYIK